MLNSLCLWQYRASRSVLPLLLFNEFRTQGRIEMKIFKTIVLALMIAINLQTGYYALLYKVQIATGVFLICLGLTLFVASDGGMN